VAECLFVVFSNIFQNANTCQLRKT